MRWLLLSLLLAAGNSALLALIAAGLLQVPLLLPMFLGLFAFIAAVASTVAAASYRSGEGPETLLLFASILLWGILLPVNLSVYNWGVM